MARNGGAGIQAEEQLLPHFVDENLEALQGEEPCR